MPTGQIELSIALDAGPEADKEELDQLTRALVAEIRESTDVELAKLKTKEAEPGSKPGEAFEIGGLIVSLAGAGVFTALIEMLKGWALRKEGRSIKIETTIGDRSVKLEYSPTAASQDDLTRFIADITRALEPTESSA